MATRSSILAWRIPQTEEPGGLQSIELQRVRHDRVQCTNTSACLKLKEKLKETGNIFHNIIYFGWPSCWQRADLQNRLHFKRSYNFLGKKKRIFLPSSLVFYLLCKALNLHIQTLQGSRCFWGG